MAKRENGLYKIGELAARTGVSRQTIHYYLKEGLLEPPLQSGRNIAYYGQTHIEDIRLIKELQEKRYLPLAVIKTILESRRSGLDMAEPDHLEAFENWMRSPDSGTLEKNCTRQELKERCELAEETLQLIEATGLLAPVESNGELLYSSTDSALAGALKALFDLGLEPSSASIYSQHLKLIRTELGLLHEQVIHGFQNQHHPPLQDLGEARSRVLRLLTRKAFAELFGDHPHSDK